ncbi:MAG TPA: energy-coupling factor transporter transmembrane component T [Candidatus Limnocylindrales bacterium]
MVATLHRAVPARREGRRVGGRVTARPSVWADLADDLDPEDAALVARLVPPTPTAHHRLNPLTKAVIATVGSVGAFVFGGYLGPIVLSAVMLLLAGAAGVSRQLIRASVLLSLPIAMSVVLVSVFTRPGTTVLFTLGPFDATVEGVDFAAQTIVRLLAISLSIGLFILTTDSRAFVFDLERRGVSPRFAFVALATVEAVPTLVERATTISESQRARGLDTEGSLRSRLAGVLPLVGPAVITSLTDVEERSLALESRAFSRPGRRQLLWSMPDPGRERVLRRVLILGLVGAAIARVAGVPLPGLG